MVGVFVGWAAAAIVLVLATALLGWSVRGNVLGILIDARGRYSLTQLQLVLWTIVILSLVLGVFVGRVAGGLGKNALAFSIPNELLVVLGIRVRPPPAPSSSPRRTSPRRRRSRLARRPTHLDSRRCSWLRRALWPTGSST